MCGAVIHINALSLVFIQEYLNSVVLKSLGMRLQGVPSQQPGKDKQTEQSSAESSRHGREGTEKETRDAGERENKETHGEGVTLS